MTTPTQENRYPTALTVDDFKHNLAVVRQKIAAACQRSGRDAFDKWQSLSTLNGLQWSIIGPPVDKHPQAFFDMTNRTFC